MKKTSKLKPRYLSFIFLLLCILGFSFWMANSFWISLSLDYDTAYQGTITHETDVKTYFANDEKLIFSPMEGNIQLPKQDGQRFGKGEQIAVLTPAGVNYAVFGDEVTIQAPAAGLFYSCIDTMEEIMTPENLMKMELTSLITETERLHKVYSEEFQINSADQSVTKNKVIGKIINNLAPSWAFVSLPSVDGLMKGDRMRFKVADQEYQAEVLKLSSNPKGAVVKFSEYVHGSTEDRIQSIQWIEKTPTQGIIIPFNALYTRGEERGVFISEKGALSFKSVRIVDYNQEYACIENIPAGQKIVVNPKKKLEDLVVTGI